VSEFWRRWHISLSGWFRDYVYIPMGGSRCSKARQLLNLAVVWVLTGLWHGAHWTFVLWGVWFLLLLAGEKFLWGRGLAQLPSAVRCLYTMLAVIFSWVLFRSADLAYAVSYFGAMFGVSGAVQDGQAVYWLLEYWPEWIACLAAALPVRLWIGKALERSETRLADFTREWIPKGLALCLLVLSYMKLASGSFNPFIYFQF
jgi:alginate O-acetyltransferase complex protein AlgI